MYEFMVGRVICGLFFCFRLDGEPQQQHAVVADPDMVADEVAKLVQM